jgi:hypothetical protein
MKKQIEFTGENGTFTGSVEIDTLENVFELRSYVGDKLDKLQRCTTDKEVLIIQAQMANIVNYELEKLATNEKTLQEQLIELGYS